MGNTGGNEQAVWLYQRGVGELHWAFTGVSGSYGFHDLEPATYLVHGPAGIAALVDVEEGKTVTLDFAGQPGYGGADDVWSPARREFGQTFLAHGTSMHSVGMWLPGPPVPLEERISSTAEKLREFLIGMVPLGALISATLGSILAGLATPTEAASMGCLGAIVLGLLYRGLDWPKLKESTIRTLQTSSMILFLALASNIFGSVFARLGSATMITNAMIGLQLSPIVMLLIVMALIFILGWPFEFILLDLYPVKQHYGIIDYDSRQGYESHESQKSEI